MPRYYLDIETCPLEEYYNPEVDDKSLITDTSKNKIITIQFQSLAFDTGVPTDELTILKEWESSEEGIVKEFAKTFGDNLDVWKFVPVGNNLDFEMIHLIPKLKKYCGIELDPFHKPSIDVKPILITINGGRFTGYSKVLGKNGTASNMANWYYKEDYNSILDYITNETESFLDSYQILCHNLPLLKQILKQRSETSEEMHDLR
jgi:hypothetical protein